ncbi:MAG: EAL domain-containing protein [Butyrivibrio sp.]|nr:EAL domain-containing protein [Butyrivibrio sp.]
MIDKADMRRRRSDFFDDKELVKAKKIDSITEYVIENIDQAIENEWIEVFYQPVIRTVTGQLCGVESLSRWVDPQVGLLFPDKFIGALEDAQIIHKLDCYMVEKVCKDLHEFTKAAVPIVPVSVNFSRLDFLMCDMLEVVENAVKKYDIPRDYIHIEITESMFISDEFLMHGVISSFRKAGYEIWMDDFGSGYSSLNLLKDNQFDMLKMDMNFITSFTEKSKAIMRSTISMAKDIGMKTLAEGVETEEQVEFLKNIGCEMIQGYFYGRPEKMMDMFSHLAEKRISVEMRQWRHFYEVAGFHIRDIDTPLEIIEDDGKAIRTLFMNRAYREQIFMEGVNDIEEIDRRIYHTSSPLMKRYREMINVMIKEDGESSFYYTINGNYFRLNCEILAENNGHHIIKGRILNITKDERNKNRNLFDSKLRELNQLFEVVHLIDANNNKIIPLLGGFKYLKARQVGNTNYDCVMKAFAEEFLHPNDKENFLIYVDFTNIRREVENSDHGYIGKYFRIKQENGNYVWYVIFILRTLSSDGFEYLWCMKQVTLDVVDALNEIHNNELYRTLDNRGKESGLDIPTLFENLVMNTSYKFFWKDKNRRFMGVSQAFLDFYGIKSLDEIIGKTDEEMQWHVDNSPYMDDEIDVIGKGKRVINAKGQCIVSGVVHDIRCKKMPVYKEGEIVGLVGSFVDESEELDFLTDGNENQIIDHLTGLMSARALNLSMYDYAEQYADKARNYGLIILRSTKFDRILSTYGESICDKFVKRMGESIVSVTGQTCAVARLKESYFAILTYVDKRNALEGLAGRIVNQLETIHEIEGNRITARIKYASKLRSDPDINDVNLYQKALEEVEKPD